MILLPRRCGAFLCLLVLALWTKSLPAQQPDEIRDLLRQVETMKRLPINGLSLVEVGGRSFLVSDNGRFAIVGTLIDTWSGEVVRTAADVEKTAKVPLQRLGLKAAELGALAIGRGSREILAFVDPLCPHCHALLSQFAAGGRLGADWTVQAIPLPMLSQRSVDAVRSLHCAKDRADAARLLAAGDIERLPKPGDCAGMETTLPRALVTARILGIRSVPTLILPSGRVVVGNGPDLAATLAAEAVEAKR